ncbi:unnamed protein product [Acanthoscelides obtectus]|uniref:Uncharacterized protein n=1 Tax=Acanthoscelides obtectus TaxID=200917 RepID=A0A9P0LE78_ACAOB|nr:unnamed protein product [Acanthoscelides obtectus]CAK1624365.1 hypothetical protein AOBTE_LOCUS2524 [Acanthoscelides obtectus]
MPADELSQIVLDVIRYIQMEGFKVLCVFRCLCNGDVYFSIPSDPAEKIFTLFDFVHIFKNIYHNWLNLKNVEHTFLYPNYNNFDVQEKASFENIRSFYKNEIEKLTRLAYKLNDKTLYPNNLERQSVVLANNVFHESTIAALKTCSSYSSTANFLQIVHDWWSIINVKNTLKGTHKRDDHSCPIIPFHDENFKFLKKFLNWLDACHQNIQNVGLSTDTYNALKHSTSVMIKLVDYSFEHFPVEYVLCGKFQTDNLEKRFGRYRYLSGCNYHISFNQILESEKKIRLQNVLKTCNTEFDLNELRNSSLTSEQDTFSLDISDFLFILETDYLISYDVDEAVKIYICGYVGHSLIKKLVVQNARKNQLGAKVSCWN